MKVSEVKVGDKLYLISHDLDLFKLRKRINPYTVSSVTVTKVNKSSIHIVHSDSSVDYIFKRRSKFPLSENNSRIMTMGTVEYLTDDPTQGDKWWAIKKKDLLLNSKIDSLSKKIKALSISHKESIISDLEKELREK